MSDLLVTSLWHVVWLLCAFAILPALMLRSTDERLAAVIAIAAGVALIVLPVWWLGTLFGLPFSRGTLFASWVAVALLGWGSIVRRRDWSALSRLARSTWPFVIAHSLAFTSYLLFRSYAPAIRYTEKPMELAFLSSSIGSSRLPSPDPWFTGYPINYYAFGYVQMAAVAKVIGVEPERAFNLALASLFAGALVTVTATAGRLAARDGGQFRWSAALLAGLLLVGVGNWQTAWQFLRDPLGTLHASWWAGPGWNASRVIVDAGFPWDGAPRPTINEFPAFSFVLGDLHPHVLALPLLGAYLASLTVFPDQKRPMLGAVLPGVLFGCLWVTNTWAVPLAGLVAALVFVTRPWPSGSSRLFGALVFGAVAIAVSAPFQVHYVPSYGLLPQDLPWPIARVPGLSWLVRTVGVVVWERSSWGELLRAYGTLLLPGAIAVGLRVASSATTHRLSTGVMVAVVGFAMVLAVASATPALVLVGLPLLASLWLLWRREHAGERWYDALPLLTAAWTGLLAVEFLFLRDAFGDRMNTVFKVSFDAWVLQAVAIPAPLLSAANGRPRWVRRFLHVPVILALLAGALYPPLSVWKWTDGFARFEGIDGLSYLRQSHADELAAMKWIRATTPPDAVVLEIPGCSYGAVGDLPHARVSTVTGRPTILGWEGHEYQWRRGSIEQLAALSERARELRQFFEDPTPQQVARLLERYDVSYVYVGTLERDGLGPNCTVVGTPQATRLAMILERLGWQPVYRNPTVTLYARPDLAVASLTGEGSRVTIGDATLGVVPRRIGLTSG